MLVHTVQPFVVQFPFALLCVFDDQVLKLIAELKMMKKTAILVRYVSTPVGDHSANVELRMFNQAPDSLILTGFIDHH